MNHSRTSKRKAYIDLEVYPDTSDEEDDVRTRKTFYHHTVAVISDTGARTATSAVAGPSSPKKVHGPAFFVGGTHSDKPEAYSNALDEQFNFLQDGFFDSWNAEHESARRRVRTGAVSHPTSIRNYFLITNRIIL